MSTEGQWFFFYKLYNIKEMCVYVWVFLGKEEKKNEKQKLKLNAKKGTAFFFCFLYLTFTSFASTLKLVFQVYLLLYIYISFKVQSILIWFDGKRLELYPEQQNWVTKLIQRRSI